MLLHRDLRGARVRRKERLVSLIDEIASSQREAHKVQKSSFRKRDDAA